ncbi:MULTISPECIES: hypothetical protein [Stenotrophomonas]|nr:MULTISPECIES: hypothetical protein [Stenotrophomonas]
MTLSREWPLADGFMFPAAPWRSVDPDQSVAAGKARKPGNSALLD